MQTVLGFLSTNVYPITVFLVTICYAVNSFSPGFKVDYPRKGRFIQHSGREWFFVTFIGLVVSLLVGYWFYLQKLVLTPVASMVVFMLVTSLYSDCFYRRVDRYVLRIILLFSLCWIGVFYYVMLPYAILSVFLCCVLFFVKNFGQSDVRALMITTVFLVTNNVNVLAFVGCFSLIMGMVLLLSLLDKYKYLLRSIPFVPVLFSCCLFGFVLQ